MRQASLSEANTIERSLRRLEDLARARMKIMIRRKIDAVLAVGQLILQGI
jgi:hypothetical protein